MAAAQLRRGGACLGLHRGRIYAAAACLLRPPLGECASHGEYAGPGTRAGKSRADLAEQGRMKAPTVASGRDEAGPLGHAGPLGAGASRSSASLGLNRLLEANPSTGSESLSESLPATPQALA